MDDITNVSADAQADQGQPDDDITKPPVTDDRITWKQAYDSDRFKKMGASIRDYREKETTWNAERAGYASEIETLRAQISAKEAAVSDAIASGVTTANGLRLVLAAQIAGLANPDKITNLIKPESVDPTIENHAKMLVDDFIKTVRTEFALDGGIPGGGSRTTTSSEDETAKLEARRAAEVRTRRMF